MTTRLKGLTVAFATDIREDHAEAIIAAIKMVKGVLDVKPIESPMDDWIVEERVRRDLHQKLFDLVYPKVKA